MIGSIGNYVGYSSLQAKLRKGVCELFIVRRHRPVRGHIRPTVTSRRMLCSNCPELLNSTLGVVNLAYRKPKHSDIPLHFDPRAKNLIITWDIVMQDYRCINMDECLLVGEYPVNKSIRKIKKNDDIISPFVKRKATQDITVMNDQFFWEFVYNEMIKMPLSELAYWMDS